MHHIVEQASAEIFLKQKLKTQIIFTVKNFPIYGNYMHVYILIPGI